VTPARATDTKWYEAKIEKLRLLDSPITLAELRTMFPDWAWLRNANMFAYVSPDRANALLQRSAGKSQKSTRAQTVLIGAGFGDAKKNAIVERAAVRKVTRDFQRRGFDVISREGDAIGYDLDAKKGSTEWHIEVKGVSGEQIRFPITRNEVVRAETDKSFRLVVVTEARQRNARLHTFQGQEIADRFVLQPISYMAAKK
jgi:hypothetical protein